MLLQYMSSVTFFYFILSALNMNRSKHGVSLLLVGDHSLVQPTVFVRKAVRLHSVCEVKLCSKDVDVLLRGHQLGTDVDSGAGKEVFSSTAEICSAYIASEGKKDLALLWLKLIIIIPSESQ